MGASGSGKSTLLHMIGLLDRPTSGRYFLENQDVAQLGADDLADLRSRRLGFVFQAYNLLARTTAVENVELPMMYAGVPDAERRRRALAALAIVGVANMAEHVSNQMSGGQQQRVAHCPRAGERSESDSGRRTDRCARLEIVDGNHPFVSKTQ